MTAAAIPMRIALRNTRFARSPGCCGLRISFFRVILRPKAVSKGISSDKGYDSAENNAVLFDDHGIKPVIDTRTLWKTKTHKTLFPERFDVFSCDEAGQVFCSCPSEKRGQDEMRPLAFVGFEKDRNTLKYRCPAAAFGFECAGRVECEKHSPVGVGDFGRIVRVPLALDRRIFTPIARHTERWKKAYKRRTSIERVNSRIDQVLGFEHLTIRGNAKMETRVTLALVVLLAMALGRIRIGRATRGARCSLLYAEPPETVPKPV